MSENIQTLTEWKHREKDLVYASEYFALFTHLIKNAYN